MELRTYLSFSQVMVAPLVLIFSRSGYQWHLTTNKPHLAAPINDEVFQIMFGKRFHCHSNVRSNFLGLEKKKAFEGIISQFGAQVSSKTFLKL